MNSLISRKRAWSAQPDGSIAADSRLVRLGPVNEELENDARARFGLGAEDVIELVDVATPKRVLAQLARPRLATLILTTPKPSRATRLGPFAAWLLAARPRCVVVAKIDGGWRDQTMWSFFGENLGGLFTQILGAPLVALAHFALFWALSRRPIPRHLGPDLRHILYVRTLPGYLPSAGGSITHTNEVVRALHEVGVHVAFREAVLAEEAVPVCDDYVRWSVPLAARLLPGLLTMGGDLVLALRARHATRAADAIYQRITPCSAAGLMMSALTGRPLIVECNQSSDHDNPQPLLSRYERLVERWNFRRAARIVVVSEVLRQHLIARGVDADRIVVNPNGVDPARFGNDRTERSALGLAEDDVVFAFLGTFGFWHGSLVLADAFVRLARERPQARLLLIGDGNERGQCERIIREAGLSNAVRSMGRVRPHLVPGLLEAADVLCSPHIPWRDGLPFHGSPTKIFEYMAAKRAIVASDLGQIGDVLTNEQSALLVPAGDAISFSRAMIRLHDDPDLRHRLGTTAAECVRQNYTWQAHAYRILRANTIPSGPNAASSGPDTTPSAGASAKTSGVIA